MTKPPYRVPTMAELRAVEPSGYRVVSTFTGAGGSCTGFRLAGFTIAWASEFVAAARETYAANWPDTPLDDRDIREVDPAEILAAIGGGELDVLEGSPPCSSFSMAGKRDRGWGETRHYSDERSQRTDDLFPEYVRLLKGLRPRAFVAENVAGMVRGKAKGYFIDLYGELEAAGYVVEARLLDAQWLGVPQARSRIIFTGLRADLVESTGVRPRLPAPFPYRYSLRDVLPDLGAAQIEDARTFSMTGAGHSWYGTEGPADPVLAARPVRVRAELVHRNRGFYLAGGPTYVVPETAPAPTIAAGGSGEYRVRSRGKTRPATEPAPTVQTHGRRGTRSELVVETRHLKLADHVEGNVAPSLDGYAIGREAARLAPGRSSDKYLNLSRAHGDEPSPTVTAAGGGAQSAPGGVASVIHPTEPRKFTIDELRVISSFPPDYVLTGTYAQQWERVGRAVPPLMMYAVARELRAVLEEVDR
jgi:DNA (cytosine-5)-methyltransferase 1